MGGQVIHDAGRKETLGAGKWMQAGWGLACYVSNCSEPLSPQQSLNPSQQIFAAE